MNHFTALTAESARHNASAHDWHTSDKAVALIARWLFADDIFQTIGGHGLLDTQDALFLDMQDIESELDSLRDECIADEISSLSERDADDDYLIEAIEESAPTVSKVLEDARKTSRLSYLTNALAPVTRISATGIAA